MKIEVYRDSVLTNVLEYNTEKDIAFFNEQALMGAFGQEYTTIEVDDIAQKEVDRINSEALAYLASTDWMVIREAESGVAFSQEVKDLRAAARLSIVR